MQVEELLQTLRDVGLQDEEIKALLNEAIASLEIPAEQEQPEAPKVENEEEKLERVFGA